MRMRIKSHSTVLALCLSLAATAASAGDSSAAPPVPPRPSPPPAQAVTADIPTPPAPPNIDEAQLQARMEAARQRLEVAAQQLAALSAQMSGPMVQQFGRVAGPPHALIGVQLDRTGSANGARVREVSPGGPAEQAGVRAGDVIVAVNGSDVSGKGAARRVVELLHDVKPGDRVGLRISSNGKTRDLTVIARPDAADVFFVRRLPPLPLPPDFPDVPDLKGFSTGDGPMIIAGPVADMELAKLTPALGRYFGTDSGVLVVRAPADGALGLQDGDVILSIDGRKPIDSSHVIRILSSYDPGEKMTLEVVRLHRTISVATTVPAEPGLRGRVLLRNGAMIGSGPEVTLRLRDR